ncbi:MAG: hypothetical protein WD733_06630, partial [Bryobacterales bacterium]
MISDKPIWAPSPECIRQANLTEFLAFLQKEGFGSFEDYGALYKWSVESPGEFWPAVWDFC